MDDFGKNDPANTPPHFFWGCLHLDYESAVRADVSRQTYSVCPRFWYIDATLKCAQCSEAFQFTAAEQQHWYEELGFCVDSYAKNCPACRRDGRGQKLLRQKYDCEIESALQSGDAGKKQRMIDVIDQLSARAANLPRKIHNNRQKLEQQIRQGIATKKEGGQ